MKKTAKIIAVALILVVVAVLATNSLLTNTDNKFYVGVTYCGSTVEEAKLLIDKVKNYTNLFVLQSGPILQSNGTLAINEIGDYAIEAGLSYIIYFGTDSTWIMKDWLDSYDGRWNSNFLGFYFGDEPGGKMLEGFRYFNDSLKGTFSKYSGGLIQWNINDTTQATYTPDGSIRLSFSTPDGSLAGHREVIYYLNGTITDITYKIKIVSENEIQTVPASIVLVKDNSTLEYTYQELCNARPFQSDEETAQLFINENKLSLNKLGPRNYAYLTSDYGLYWYDYQSGYDLILAQFRWNESITQDIALVRGAANAFGRDWGAIITWKYDQPPYLPAGEELYQQMCTAYENGASYVVVFNYASDMKGAYGTLTEDHFQALERFWNKTVNNPSVKHGSVRAEAVFVLPKNFGSGLRSQHDIVWGLWSPTEAQQQIWIRLQEALVLYGQELDVIYDDSAYAVVDKYTHVIYWNQTS